MESRVVRRYSSNGDYLFHAYKRGERSLFHERRRIKLLYMIIRRLYWGAAWCSLLFWCRYCTGVKWMFSKWSFLSEHFLWQLAFAGNDLVNFIGVPLSRIFFLSGLYVKRSWRSDGFPDGFFERPGQDTFVFSDSCRCDNGFLFGDLQKHTT